MILNDVSNLFIIYFFSLLCMVKKFIHICIYVKLIRLLNNSISKLFCD